MGYELVLQVASLVSEFPDIQKYGLSVQLLKSSNSIIANIAEAQGRFTYADKIRVLYIARGELYETLSHLKVALGLNYLDNDNYIKLIDAYESLLKSLHAYIRYLTDQIEK